MVASEVGRRGNHVPVGGRYDHSHHRSAFGIDHKCVFTIRGIQCSSIVTFLLEFPFRASSRAPSVHLFLFTFHIAAKRYPGATGAFGGTRASGLRIGNELTNRRWGIPTWNKAERLKWKQYNEETARPNLQSGRAAIRHEPIAFDLAINSGKYMDQTSAPKPTLHDPNGSGWSFLCLAQQSQYSLCGPEQSATGNEARRAVTAAGAPTGWLGREGPMTESKAHSSPAAYTVPWARLDVGICQWPVNVFSSADVLAICWRWG